MAVAVAQRARRASQAVAVAFGHARDRHWRRALWLLLVVLHTAYALAYAMEARLYFETLLYKSFFTYILRIFGRQQRLQANISIAVMGSSALIALWHLVALVRLIQASIARRRVVFPRVITSASVKRVAVPATPITDGKPSSVIVRASRSCVWLALSAPARLWERFGGVDGEYYELVTDVRESIEIATQTRLLYRMSRFVAHAQLTHVAAVVLVGNCWSTPLLRQYWTRHGNPDRGRLVRAVVGIVLATYFTVVVPFQVFLLYYPHARAPVAMRYDPTRFVDMGNLFQQIFTLTWPDWLSTRFAALMAGAALETIKRKLSEPARVPTRRRTKPLSRSTHVVKAASTSAVVLQTTSETRAEEATSTPQVPTPSPQQQLQQQQQQQWRARAHVALSATSRIANISFAVVGLGVLLLQTHATLREHSATTLDRAGIDCSLVVRPWFQSATVCSVLKLNCHRLGVAGLSTDWDAILPAAMLPYLSAIAFLHCPSLQVPAQVQQMQSLVQFEIYNSTIARWTTEAALTLSRNPSLSMVALLSVRGMATLPDGMLAPDFPAISIDIADADLADLPDNLTQLWPLHIEHILCERCRMRAVPRVLGQMHVARVSLAVNAIATVPVEFLQEHTFERSLMLSNNPIDALPDGPIAGFRARNVELFATNISALPPWLRAAAQDSIAVQPFVSAGGAPVCASSPDDVRTLLLNCSQLTDVATWIALPVIALDNPV